MNAAMLYLKDGRAAQIWHCAECKVVYRDEGSAEQCCRPRLCKCGAECRSGWLVCRACREAAEQERQAKLIQEAKKIPASEWDGPVWVMDSELSFQDLGMLYDHYECEGEKPPSMVWGTRPMKLHLDAEMILEHATEEMYEDAFDSIDTADIPKLQYVLDGWVKEYGPSPGWETDYGIVVILEDQ